MAVRPAGYFGSDDIAAWLISKSLAAKFVSAVEARDREKVIALLTKALADKDGQTAEVLADSLSCGQHSVSEVESLKSSADAPSVTMRIRIAPPPPLRG